MATLPKPNSQNFEKEIVKFNFNKQTQSNIIAGKCRYKEISKYFKIQ